MIRDLVLAIVISASGQVVAQAEDGSTPRSKIPRLENPESPDVGVLTEEEARYLRDAFQDGGTFRSHGEESLNLELFVWDTSGLPVAGAQIDLLELAGDTSGGPEEDEEFRVVARYVTDVGGGTIVDYKFPKWSEIADRNQRQGFHLSDHALAISSVSYEPVLLRLEDIAVNADEVPPVACTVVLDVRPNYALQATRQGRVLPPDALHPCRAPELRR